MSDVITFGELMLRLSPPGYQRFVQARSFDVYYGGAEANVAVSLAQWGIDVAFVTSLPESALGDAALNELRRYGVDTRFVKRSPGRLGIYFAEKGASQRGSTVLYDRLNSSFQQSKSKEWDWNKIFNGSKWFHFTGITPALSPQVAETTLAACKAAKKMGITISCDLNYRSKLWTKQSAQSTMSQLCPYLDICIANEADPHDVFNISLGNSDIINGKIDISIYRDVAKKIQDKFGIKTVAITLRKSLSASDNHWSAIMQHGDEFYQSHMYHVHIVDRIGGGDAFGAGLIYSLIKNKNISESLEYAVAASCLKHSIEGDFNLISESSVITLVNGQNGGRIQR